MKHEIYGLKLGRMRREGIDSSSMGGGGVDRDGRRNEGGEELVGSSKGVELASGG